MTNCIGFVNLTTGTSDRGPVTLVRNALSYKPRQEISCDVSNVEQSTFAPLWLMSCWFLFKYHKVQHWPVTDQIKKKMLQEHIIATLWWISSGVLFMTVRHFFGWFHSVECLSYRRKLHLQMLGALASKVTSKTSLRCGWTGGSHQLTSLQQLYDIIVESMPWRLEAVFKP